MKMPALPKSHSKPNRVKKKNKPIERSRKQIRKEQRKRKKVAKAEYYQKRKLSVKAKYGKAEKNEINSQLGKSNEVIDVQKANEEKKQIMKQQKEQKLQKEREKQRKRLLKDENLKEDKLIKKLEKQLKLNKRKKKAVPKSFVADGLDYILDFCSEENRKRAVDVEMQLAQNDVDFGFKEDLNLLTGAVLSDGEDFQETESVNSETTDKIDNSDINSSTDEFNDEPIDNESDCNETVLCKKTSAKKQKTKGNVDSCENQDNDINEDEYYTDNPTDEKDKNSDELWEDIYGRKRDQTGNVIPEVKKYVPPAARALNKANTNDEKLNALKKKLKGCINRVAEHNMHSIANQIEDLYMSHSRNDVNDLISQLMLDALVAPILTPDRLISEHMMLIAILHANVGTEVGAHFLEMIIKKCINMLGQNLSVENKELDNIILMISHLYNFKVYGHKLLYQILEKLLQKFKEKEIELVLLMLKTVGFPLRKDDPIALKEFIQKVQQKANDEKAENSRAKFMLDILLAIKNNNMNKIPQYDPSYVEHLKKVLKSILRKGNSVTQFNVTLEDLLHADERGKWWVVGSAWSGSINANTKLQSSTHKELIFGRDILELARKQRMNTDARKNIFCILMTAEDYLDAFEKLHHMGLKDKQEREVVHVLMHCCLQERNFNLYYAILAQKLCEYDRKYQLTIQYALWDKLKALDGYTVTQLCNLARFLTHLFIEKGLAFSVLKVIQFAELDKKTMRLVRQIMFGVLLHADEDASLQVFERIATSPQLQNFRESVRLFINHFLIKNINTSGELTEKEVILKKRAQLVDRILTAKSSRVVF